MMRIGLFLLTNLAVIVVLASCLVFYPDFLGLAASMAQAG